MVYDRKIHITVGASRKATDWQPQELRVSELWEKLKIPSRGTETQAEYMALPKSRQDALKDVGGFVAGTIAGRRRKASAVTGRDVVTLDLDRVEPGGTGKILAALSGLGCGYCVYSTRKHAPAAPRLRVLLPLDRTVTAEEYEPVARKAASYIDPTLMPFDPTTFEASRLMYWPSCSADAEYIWDWADKPFLAADGVLAQYADWRDVGSWPQPPGAEKMRERRALTQQDPEEKAGVVGAFCREYDVIRAIDELLPGVYEPCGEGRYTFTGGSTTGGAVVYDGGKFLFSHHATDPCGGMLVNAFDLVRLHKYGGLDEEAKPGTPAHNLPSFKAMAGFAASIPAVREALDRERLGKVSDAFAPLDAAGQEPEDTGWMRQLDREAEGKIKKTTRNVLLTLLCKRELKGRIRRDLFADRIVGIAPLPWSGRDGSEGKFEWSDADDAGLRDYIERFLGFRSREVIDDAFLQAAERQSFHPVRDYLKSLHWDGVPRLDTLYIDYLGAEDSDYTRAIARKAFTAAVARVMNPGVKFDTMTVICGGQGIGKTTFVLILGRQWAATVESFEGKDAAENLQGLWLVEVGELGALQKSELNVIKGFLSKTVDRYRSPYARRSKAHPRQCVFFGTTNNPDYLRDTTGNRRFWPVDAGAGTPVKNIFRDLPGEVDQIWAEAVVRYKAGEPLILPAFLEAVAETKRELHAEVDPLQGQVEAFLNIRVPVDWQNWEYTRRMTWYSGNSHGDTPTKLRDKVCVLEIWKECLGNRNMMQKWDATRLNAIMDKISGWKKSPGLRFGGEYGRGRGYQRITSATPTTRQQPVVNTDNQDNSRQQGVVVGKRPFQPGFRPSDNDDNNNSSKSV